MNIPYVFKKCSKCGEWLVANSVNFGKGNCRYGLYSYCKQCMKKYNNSDIGRKRHIRYNKSEKCKQTKSAYKKSDKGRQQDHDYYVQHKEQITQYYKQWSKTNEQQLKQYRQQYYQTPQGQVSLFNNTAKRRQRKEEQGAGLTKEQWLEMMQFFDFKCAYSGIYIGGKENKGIRSIDHIIPLVKGGAHEVWNCVPMFASYNKSKQDKDIMEWYTAQDFYSKERLDKIYEWQQYAYNKWSNTEEAQ